jgi:hypothetical protein
MIFTGGKKAERTLTRIPTWPNCIALNVTHKSSILGQGTGISLLVGSQALTNRHVGRNKECGGSERQMNGERRKKNDENQPISKMTIDDFQRSLTTRTAITTFPILGTSVLPFNFNIDSLCVRVLGSAEHFDVANGSACQQECNVDGEL